MSNVRFVNWNSRRLIAALVLVFILALPGVARADSPRPKTPPASPYRNCSFYVRGKTIYVAVTGRVKLYHKRAFVRSLTDGVWVVAKVAANDSLISWQCR